MEEFGISYNDECVGMDDLGAVLLNQNIWNEQNAAHENFDNEMDQDEDRDAEGTFDGGVARGADDATERKSSSECELVRNSPRSVRYSAYI